MIRDLSETLRAVLDDPALPFPDLAAANIVFERPAPTFTPGQTTVDLFLYDVRENLELRSNEQFLRPNGTRRKIEPPPRRIECSYLVTAWPVGGAEPALQEHRLLAQTLRTLGRYPTIPTKFLQGELVGQAPPLPMVAPQIDGLKSPADFWTAMGNQLRASFTVTVTISVPVQDDFDAPLVTTARAGYGMGAGVEETIVSIGGTVRDATGQPIARAVVSVLDAGLSEVTEEAKDEITDGKGRFRFERIPQGTRQFRVAAVGFQTLTRAVPIPGRSEDYEFSLTPL